MMSGFKKYNFPKETFIGGWFIPTNICDNLISYFNNNKHRTNRGKTNIDNVKKVDLDIKDSFDLHCKFDHNSITKEYTNYLQYCLEQYSQLYKSVNFINPFSLEDGTLNIQYYPIGGGYKDWHFERGSKSNKSRVLAFMTYLNDVEDGGTEFYYQNIRTPAKKGLTLIWPTDFTHTHRGQISNTKEKYIITGWYAFNE